MQYSMTIYALVSENSPVKLWGLDSAQRLQRQLEAVRKKEAPKFEQLQWLSHSSEIPAKGQILILNGSFLFENRTLKGVLDKANSILLHANGSIAAAFVDSNLGGEILALIQDDDQQVPDGIEILHTRDMEAFDESLKRSTRPLLEPVTMDNKTALENRLYGNAYKGITDLVTKFVWPKPAKRVVRVCARLHISPNMVTSSGLLLVVAACYLFLQGHYAWGLLAGWIMTFLDTVDGKLARVTIQSSQFGHLYDHLIDLFHPPFWYIYWGMSLLHFEPLGGLDQVQMYWAIVIAYVVGRVVEGLFPLLGQCSIFTWRPFDAWFRLVTARRNPCLILLTLSILVGRPDWGFIAVTWWSIFTSAILVLRLLQAGLVRMRGAPLVSWLSDDDVAVGPHARSYAMFGATRGAYAR
jgi:phosphatidylglycerophosphate synthase